MNTFQDYQNKMKPIALFLRLGCMQKRLSLFFQCNSFLKMVSQRLTMLNKNPSLMQEIPT